jgi:hypothetical protein
MVAEIKEKISTDKRMNELNMVVSIPVHRGLY